MRPDLARRDPVTQQQDQALNTAIPDLRDLPLDLLEDLGGTALAHSIALYRERLRENGMPLSSFQARI
jgi:hypothetical protein